MLGASSTPALKPGRPRPLRAIWSRDAAYKVASASSSRVAPRLFVPSGVNVPGGVTGRREPADRRAARRTRARRQPSRSSQGRSSAAAATARAPSLASTARTLPSAAWARRAGSTWRSAGCATASASAAARGPNSSTHSRTSQASRDLLMRQTRQIDVLDRTWSRRRGDMEALWEAIGKDLAASHG